MLEPPEYVLHIVAAPDALQDDFGLEFRAVLQEIHKLSIVRKLQ